MPPMVVRWGGHTKDGKEGGGTYSSKPADTQSKTATDLRQTIGSVPTRDRTREVSSGTVPSHRVRQVSTSSGSAVAASARWRCSTPEVLFASAQ